MDILGDNTEGSFCEEKCALSKMLIDRVRWKSLDYRGWQSLFEFKTIDIQSRIILLGEDEREDLVTGPEDFSNERHSFWEDKIRKGIAV